MNTRFVALCFAIAPMMPAAAQTAYGPRMVHLSILDRETGQEKPVYLHDRRYFVAAQTGQRYALRVQNETGARVLVVLSVDGVNVISGETADTNQRGYILSPYQSTDIAGWRKSETEIAAFRFAPLPQSYAARTGRPGEIGVIGMAVFQERVVRTFTVFPGDACPRSSVSNEIIVCNRREYDEQYRIPPGVATAPPPPPPLPSPPPFPITTAAPVVMPAPSSTAAAASIADAGRSRAPAREKLGTAHGEIEYNVSYTAPFERATPQPHSVRVIEYDSTANLIAAGVIPPENRHPQAFPGDRRRGYVPDPPPALGGLN